MYRIFRNNANRVLSLVLNQFEHIFATPWSPANPCDLRVSTLAHSAILITD